MSISQDIDEAEDLKPVKLKFVELWAKYPERTPNEVAAYAFELCGVEPGFRFAQCAHIWSIDLDVLEARDAAKAKSRADSNVPSKEVLIAEMLERARNPKTEDKDAHALYRTILEAEGHITKQVAKETTKKTPTPPAIVFKAVDFNKDPAEQAA